MAKKNSSPWKPVISARLEPSVKSYLEKVDKDLSKLEKKFKKRPTFRLFSAGTGASLFLQYLYLHTGENKYKVRAQNFLNMASEATGLPHVTGNYASGFTCAAWVNEHLRNLERQSWNKNKDPHGEIDDYLISSVNETLNQKLPLGRYGLFDTWTGYGAYALERAPEGKSLELIKSLVRLFAQTATANADGLAWYTPYEGLSVFEKKMYRTGYFNLGVSHGNTGVIGFLTGALKLNVEPKLTKELLEKAIRWILSKDDGLPYGSVTPHDSLIDPPAKKRYRLAWCYGSLGMSMVLLEAGKVLKNKKIQKQAIKIAQRAAQISLQKSGVIDPNFCHGASGVFHIFNRLAQMTQNPKARKLFEQKSQFWLKKALRLLKERPKKGQKTLINIVDGQTGVALSLLAGLSKTPPDWDRYFMVSFR